MIQFIIKCFNYITIKTINKAIFSEFEAEYLNDNKVWIKLNSYYCGYHKHYSIDDWRFSTNHLRKNVKYVKLKFIKFI
jgi:hypothetical protein